jgi:hypothetical protein
MQDPVGKNPRSELWANRATSGDMEVEHLRLTRALAEGKR